MCAFCMPIGLGHSLASTSGIVSRVRGLHYSSWSIQALNACLTIQTRERSRQPVIRSTFSVIGSEMCAVSALVSGRRSGLSKYFLARKMRINRYCNPISHAIFRKDRPSIGMTCYAWLHCSSKEPSARPSCYANPEATRAGTICLSCAVHTRHSICLRYRIFVIRVGAITPLSTKSKPDSPGMRPCVPCPLPGNKQWERLTQKGGLAGNPQESKPVALAGHKTGCGTQLIPTVDNFEIG